MGVWRKNIILNMRTILITEDQLDSIVNKDEEIV